MTNPPLNVYTVKQAADYLGMTVDGIKYHLYKSGYLVGKTVGRDVLFTREELDRFKATAPKPGRKAKEG
jgi:excisionase family DNA binding protein